MQKLKNDIQNLIDAIYDQDCVGGPLHIVLDDQNFSDEHIEWCLQNTINSCDDIVMKVLCSKCAELLLELDEEDRISTYAGN